MKKNKEQIEVEQGELENREDRCNEFRWLNQTDQDERMLEMVEWEQDAKRYNLSNVNQQIEFLNYRVERLELIVQAIGDPESRILFTTWVKQKAQQIKDDTLFDIEVTEGKRVFDQAERE